MPAGDVDATRRRNGDRNGDRELRAMVVADPGGEGWQLVAGLLVRYAYPIVCRWIESGTIHRRAAAALAGQPAPGLELVPHDLRLDGEAAGELAGDIVTQAVRAFPGRLATSWDPDKEQMLKNCFMTCCLLELPSAHSGWSKRRPPLEPRQVPSHPEERSTIAARLFPIGNLMNMAKAEALRRRSTDGAREKESAE